MSMKKYILEDSNEGQKATVKNLVGAFVGEAPTKNLTHWTVGAFVVYETNMKFKRDKIKNNSYLNGVISHQRRKDLKTK